MLGKSQIKKKLTVIAMVTSSVALFLACASFATYEVFSFRRSMPVDLAVLAQITGDNARSALEFDDRTFAEDTLLASLAARPHVTMAVLYRPDGELFARYLGRGISADTPVPDMQPTGFLFANDHLDVYHTVESDGRQVGTVLLRSDLQALYSRITTYAGIATLVMLASLFVALILASRLQRVISEPILRLAGITASVARNQNYSVRAEKPSADEIGTLYDGFNEMLSEIQQRDEALQAAHRDLEKRVKERTADLMEAHGLLKSELEERARAEEALRVSQRKFKALVNSIDGLVWEANPETFQFTFVSEQAERLLGYPRSQWTGEKDFWKEHLLPEDKHRAIEFFRQAVATQKAHHFEYRMRAASGDILWIRDSATLVRESGRPAVLRGVLQDITEQKRAEQELDNLNKQLMETSRQAGMAEVATGVLHNVGNVLNSVNVSATLVCDRVRRSKIPSLRKVADLINQNLTDLPAFLSSNKGRLLPSYLTDLASKLADEQVEIQAELESLSKNIEHIKDIVSMQQSYARVSGVVETLSMKDLIEDSLQFNAAAYARHGVEVIREYDGSPRVSVDKHKVLQILINLFNNAKYAMDKNGPRPKRLVIGLKQKAGRSVIVTITDNGMGIAKENLTRVFNHGFTTRKDGHGFGLHSGALAAKEMGGSLTAYSGGPGVGATFTLEVPMATAQSASIAA